MRLVRLVTQQGHATLREPGECPACDRGWEELRMDARHRDNLQLARELKQPVKRYISGHPGCTFKDLYRRLECPDIPLQICLHLLVHDFQLSGPDPYACGYRKSTTYRVLHLPGPPSE